MSDFEDSEIEELRLELHEYISSISQKPKNLLFAAVELPASFYEEMKLLRKTLDTNIKNTDDPESLARGIEIRANGLRNAAINYFINFGSLDIISSVLAEYREVLSSGTRPLLARVIHNEVSELEPLLREKIDPYRRSICSDYLESVIDNFNVISRLAINHLFDTVVQGYHQLTRRYNDPKAQEDFQLTQTSLVRELEDLLSQGHTISDFSTARQKLQGHLEEIGKMSRQLDLAGKV